MQLSRILYLVGLAIVQVGCTSTYSNIMSAKQTNEAGNSTKYVRANSELGCHRLAEQAQVHVNRTNWYSEIEMQNGKNSPRTLLHSIKQTINTSEKDSLNLKLVRHHYAEATALQHMHAARECAPEALELNVSEDAKLLLK